METPLAYRAKASCQIRLTFEPRTRIVLDPAPDFWLNYFGEPTGPFRILVTEQHFTWLSVQSEEMRVTKGELILNALQEWISHAGPDITAVCVSRAFVSGNPITAISSGPPPSPAFWEF
ncbi:MAG: hypothetical protein WB696_21270 [Chthoniobacterales bacterium]